MTVPVRVLQTKRTAMRTAATWMYRSGAVQILKRLGERRRAGSLHILVYHRVNDERDAFFGGLPVAVFTSQMEFVARHFTVRPLEAALEALRRGETDDNIVAVTFDDGYMDNFTHALPVLLRLGIPATFFLTTDAIGTGRVVWHDRVFAAFRETKVGELRAFGPLAAFSLGTT